MSGTTWMVISWVFVGLFTGLNIFIFLKLKKASDQMMKMAFPGAKGAGDAMAQMQKMAEMMKRGGGNPFAGGAGGMNPQMKAAMQMLQQMQKRR